MEIIPASNGGDFCFDHVLRHCERSVYRMNSNYNPSLRTKCGNPLNRNVSMLNNVHQGKQFSIKNFLNGIHQCLFFYSIPGPLRPLFFF
jgi:hypothetical protein